MTGGNGQGVGRAVALVGTPPGDDGTVAASVSRMPRSVTGRELLGRQERPREAMLGTWLRTGEFVLLWAPTGAGKSLFALSVALAVAGGGRFLGWKGTMPPEGHSVLCVDGELPLVDIQERLAMLIEAIPEIDSERALDNVRFLSRMVRGDEGGEGDDFLSITSDEGLRTLLYHVEADKAQLVILDNLSTLGDIEDENSAGAFNPLVRTLLELKKRNVAVILIQHATKDGTTYRGSSKLPATADVVLGLDVDKSKLIGEARFTLLWQKSRARGKDLRPMTVRLAAGVVGQKDQWIIEGASSRLLQIKAMLESGRYSTKRQLATYFGVDPKVIYNNLAEGVRLELWYKDWDKDCFAAVRAKRPMPKAEGPRGHRGKVGAQRRREAKF